MTTDPIGFLNWLHKRLNVKNDAELSRVLETTPPVISKIRNGKLPIGATVLLRMHELTDMHVRDIRKMYEV